MIDYRLVADEEHKNNAGLQLADSVASAFYAAADMLDTGPCFTKAAEALKPQMAFEKVGGNIKIIRDFGVVLQPLPDYRVNITEEQKNIFKYYGYGF